MELALAIGAFVAITALIALCTCWFFHLHRRYLVVADYHSVPTTAEDEDYSPAPCTSTPSVSGDNRGNKLLLSIQRLDDDALQPQSPAPNGEREEPPNKTRTSSERTGVEQEENGAEARLLSVVVQDGKQEQLKTEENLKTKEQFGTEEQLKTAEQLWMEEQSKTVPQSRTEEQQGTELIDRYTEEGGGETEPAVVLPGCFPVAAGEHEKALACEKKKRVWWKNRKQGVCNLIPWTRLRQKDWKEEIG